VTPQDEGVDSIAGFEQEILAAVQHMRSEYHIHTERVFLAGFGAAGTLALRLGLRRPEWFAGIASLSGRFPDDPLPLRRFRDLHGKRVLLGWGARDAGTVPAEVVRVSRLLHSAGLRVCPRKYEAAHEITRSMLTDIDRWVMREMYQPAERC
jgi:predicted esterase